MNTPGTTDGPLHTRTVMEVSESTLKDFERRFEFMELGFAQQVESSNKRSTRNMILSLVGGVLGGLLPTYIAVKTVFPAPDFRIVAAAPLEISEQHSPVGIQISLQISLMNIGNTSGAITGLPVQLVRSADPARGSVDATHLEFVQIQRADSSGAARFPISVGANGNSDFVVTMELPGDRLDALDEPGNYALVFIADHAPGAHICFELKEADASRLKTQGTLELKRLATSCPRDIDSHLEAAS